MVFVSLYVGIYSCIKYFK